MCSLVTLFRPDADWPLILAANRDEMRQRPWRPPAHHWDDRPHVLAGLDETGGGTWMGMNEERVVACVLNRMGSLGPAAGKRSRGELVLEALDHASAADAAEALSALDPHAYRSFNLIVADTTGAFWLRHVGEDGTPIECLEVPEGLSLLTAHDLNDVSTKRIRHYLPRFRAAPTPDPQAGDWRAWQALLAERDPKDPYGGMTVADSKGFGTVSSSLLALPAAFEVQPIWLFAPGPPDQAPFEGVL